MHLQLQPTPRSLLPSKLRWPKSGPGRCLKSSGPSWRGSQQPVRSRRKLWRRWPPWWPCTPKQDIETITSRGTKRSTERKIRKLLPRGRESMMNNENNQWLGGGGGGGGGGGWVGGWLNNRISAPWVKCLFITMGLTAMFCFVPKYMVCRSWSVMFTWTADSLFTLVFEFMGPTHTVCLHTVLLCTLLLRN